MSKPKMLLPGDRVYFTRDSYYREVGIKFGKVHAMITPSIVAVEIAGGGPPIRILRSLVRKGKK